MKTKIYALVHPITKEVVYVGQTTKSLSERLKGNPMTKVLNPKIVILKSTNNNSIIRSFDYVFEINQFLDDRNAGGNIVRQLKKKPYTRSKGYVFRYIKDKDIEKLNN